jgi:hypothetical protein
MTSIRVEALRSMQEVAPLRADIDALNLASRRPCPHATFEFIEAYIARGESGCQGGELLFLAAFSGSRLVGYLPLRKHRAHAQLFNPERRCAEQAEHHESADRDAHVRPPCTEERESARAALRGLDALGVTMTRLSGDALERVLPFATRREAA